MKTPLLIVILLCIFTSCNTNKQTNSEESKPFDFNFESLSISQIQQDLSENKYSIENLIKAHIDRINQLDDSEDGPQLNAVICLNPNAIAIAKTLDKELKQGKTRGSLHGIPVLLKDNINTADGMPTTAGAMVLAENYTEDSPLAKQLKEAGAIILGKANLSEWANFHSSYSSSGWSAIGGQTKNPYELSRNPCGSSAGSGVSVAAGLCVFAIGTETNGSIVCPSNNNGIVGIKPTVGLISRTGIIPISETQDTPGPMARSVRDAAIALGTMTVQDSMDSYTLNEKRTAYKDYSQFLTKGSLKGKRIGYLKSSEGQNHRVDSVMNKAIEVLKMAGAEIIDVDNIGSSAAENASFTVLLYEFKDGLNKYLANCSNENLPKTLSDVIEQTKSYAEETRYFDHALLDMANEKGNLDETEYQEARALMLKTFRQEGIDKWMKDKNLDAFVAPTGGTAWKTDLINGDNYGVHSSSPAAIAGYPSITVPMGNIDGMPLNISFFAEAFSEGKLISMAYDYEQKTKHRMAPKALK